MDNGHGRHNSSRFLHIIIISDSLVPYRWCRLAARFAAKTNTVAPLSLRLALSRLLKITDSLLCILRIYFGERSTLARVLRRMRCNFEDETILCCGRPTCADNCCIVCTFCARQSHFVIFKLRCVCACSKLRSKNERNNVNIEKWVKT